MACWSNIYWIPWSRREMTGTEIEALDPAVKPRDDDGGNPQGGGGLYLLDPAVKPRDDDGG